MKIIFFYNSKSGTIINSPDLIDSAVEQIRSHIGNDDQLSVFDVQNNDELEIVKQFELNGDDKVVIAGGDGTISSVINKIIETEIPIGILPMGTFNNFSKCLGISQKVNEAIVQLFSGKVVSIDAAKVNGRIFLNNSSVGIYPKLVSIREESQINLSLNKPLAMFFSFIKALFLFPLIKVSLSSGGVEKKAKTSFVMISNNRYELAMPAVGKRVSLTEGLLYAYLIKCGTRLCVLKVLLKGLFKKLNSEKDFELISTKQLELRLNKKEVKVSTDGEVNKMSLPLKYQICSSCLNVIIPDRDE